MDSSKCGDSGHEMFDDCIGLRASAGGFQVAAVPPRVLSAWISAG